MALSNLPPGVTDQMIDDQFSGPCEECEAGRHFDCMGQDGDCRCDECKEIAEDMAADAAYEAWKERKYEQEQDEPDFDYDPRDEER